MNKLFELFERLGLPYFRQGTLTEKAYPASFFTFDNFATPFQAFYDNDNRRTIVKVQVGFYTNDVRVIYSKMNEFITEAKKAGFIVESGAYDVPSGRIDYFGRSVTIDIIQ